MRDKLGEQQLESDTLGVNWNQEPAALQHAARQLPSKTPYLT